MRVLVIWEEIPDETAFIILENIDMPTYEKLKSMHGHYINHTDDADIEDDINEFFYDDNEELMHECHKGSIEGKYFDLIIQTGIVL